MIILEELAGVPVARGRVEAVERKGLGHPDTIADSICEAVSVALSKYYKKEFGAVLHHNADKGLLAAGRAQVAFRGGRITRPMEMYIGDRATFRAAGRRVPVKEIAVEAARAWVAANLRFVRPERHMKFHAVMRPVSGELAGLYAEKKGLRGANDTSAGVGYWPLTPTEEVVLAVEAFLNGKKFKKKFPETGEDVKVMAVRQEGFLSLTVAMPMIDEFLMAESEYFVRKEMVLEELGAHLALFREKFSGVEVHLNGLDVKGKGLGGMYLTVLGTSAEGSDSGQVGRGNRVNGLITFNRPMSLEAAAGKNPAGHVGKIYNVLAHELARKICESVNGLEEVCIELVSRIGDPVNEPRVAYVRLGLKKGVRLGDVEGAVKGVMEEELGERRMRGFLDALAKGRFRVC